MKGNLSQGMLDAQTKANLLDESLKRVGMTIGGVFTAQKAVEFVKTMIDVRQEVENLIISFETLLGSKDKATQFFSELSEYAVNTPLMLNDLAGGAQTMLAFNIETEKVIPTLKQVRRMYLSWKRLASPISTVMAGMPRAAAAPRRVPSWAGLWTMIWGRCR